MYAILRFFYPGLPANSGELTAEVFENEYLSKTGKLGAIYFDWLCSFDTDFVEYTGPVYRREQRRLFIAEALAMDWQMSDLLYMLSLELDAADTSCRRVKYDR